MAGLIGRLAVNIFRCTKRGKRKIVLFDLLWGYPKPMHHIPLQPLKPLGKFHEDLGPGVFRLE